MQPGLEKYVWYGIKVNPEHVLLPSPPAGEGRCKAAG
jgi:hypothetical protein